MRPFCWTCHRPEAACFCAMVKPFSCAADFALVVHPYEVSSTVGTAWILRRSMPGLKWLRSKGRDLDTSPEFLDLLVDPESVPLLLFPSPTALNLNHASDEEWRELVPTSKRPRFFVVDGTWTQANAILRKSAWLRRLPRVSFDVVKESEYGFKKQPHPSCLSCVEGVHRTIEVLAERGWGASPAEREHDQMIEIFRAMARFQMAHERNPRMEGGLL